MPSPWPRRACSSRATATPSMPAARPRPCSPPSGRASGGQARGRPARGRCSSRSRSSAERTTPHRSPCGFVSSPAATRPAHVRASGSRRPSRREGFRLADVRGLDAAGAVVAAALAQLGWPYVWGGESRAEGGFDCSGLVDYALAAAGIPVGRLTAAGLQQLARPLAPGAGAPGRRSRVRRRAGPPRRSRRRRQGSRWRRRTAARSCTSSRSPRAAGRPRGGCCAAGAPAGARRRTRARGAGLRAAAAARRCSRARRAREQVPPALLAAQLEAESGFDASRCSPAGAQGIAQFMPATWRAPGTRSAGGARSSPAPAIAAQARLMHHLLERAGGDVARALAAYNAGPAVRPGTAGRARRAPTSPASCAASAGRRR